MMKFDKIRAQTKTSVDQINHLNLEQETGLKQMTT